MKIIIGCFYFLLKKSSPIIIFIRNSYEVCFLLNTLLATFALWEKKYGVKRNIWFDSDKKCEIIYEIVIDLINKYFIFFLYDWDFVK